MSGGIGVGHRSWRNISITLKNPLWHRTPVPATPVDTVPSVNRRVGSAYFGRFER